MSTEIITWAVTGWVLLGFLSAAFFVFDDKGSISLQTMLYCLLAAIIVGPMLIGAMIGMGIAAYGPTTVDFNPILVRKPKEVLRDDDDEEEQ